MTTKKKSAPSKFISEDHNEFLNDAEFLNNTQKNRKSKLQTDTVVNETSEISDIQPIGTKNKKYNESIEACGESRQKTLNVMSQQLENRKQVNAKMLKNLSDVITNFEADYNVLKENEQKLENLTGSLLKCLQQSTAAYKQKLKAVKEIHATYKKKYDEIDVEQKGEMEKLGSELEEDIYKLKQKLISETKRNEWENLQKYFIEAMHNNNI